MKTGEWTKKGQGKGQSRESHPACDLFLERMVWTLRKDSRDKRRRKERRHAWTDWRKTTCRSDDRLVCERPSSI